MSTEELYEVRGGIQAVSATMVNAIVKAFVTAYDIGKAFGSAIRRTITKSKC